MQYRFPVLLVVVLLAFAGACAEGDVSEPANNATNNVTTNNESDSGTDTPVARCGDGIDDIDEACDDGNTVDTDACRNICEVARCGDGVVQEATKRRLTSASIGVDASTKVSPKYAATV